MEVICMKCHKDRIRIIAIDVFSTYIGISYECCECGKINYKTYETIIRED